MSVDATALLNAKEEREEELNTLKQIADRMGIKYSKNVGPETLKAKIAEKRELTEIAKEATNDKATLRKKIQAEQLKLVRIRLTCMNPAKKAWKGEIFTVANSVIGTVKKFVPYNPKFYTNGYHIPYCIYQMLKRKTFLHITTEQNGPRTEVHTEFVPEFAIEVLPQLTKEELEQLAADQRAGNRLDN